MLLFLPYCHPQLLYAFTIYIKIASKPHIIESCCRLYAISVLQMVSGVIGISHDQDIVFKTIIPRSVRIAEASETGKSIFSYDPKGKAAEAYREFAKEVLRLEIGRQKSQLDLIR